VAPSECPETCRSAAGGRAADKGKKEAGDWARFLLRLALLLVALVLFARTLTRVLGAWILTALLRLGVLLARLALTLTLLVVLLLALTRILALTLTLLVGALIRVLLAALFVRHFKISYPGSHNAIHLS